MMPQLAHLGLAGVKICTKGPVSKQCQDLYEGTLIRNNVQRMVSHFFRSHSNCSSLLTGPGITCKSEVKYFCHMSRNSYHDHPKRNQLKTSNYQQLKEVTILPGPTINLSFFVFHNNFVIHSSCKLLLDLVNLHKPFQTIVSLHKPLLDHC